MRQDLTDMAEDFSFSENSSAASGKNDCRVCPLALLPKSSLNDLLRPPFRKRHPVLWWISLAALILVSAFAGSRLISGSGEDGQERIALVRVTGPIMDVAPVLSWIRRIENNQNVKGVLVRVDSPGGGAAASQEIYAALERIGRKLPVAVSMGSTAASGGLMVSMAGERIFANPSTVTGSIGVRMDIPQIQGLMGKLGIGQETLVTAPFKDATSYMHPMTPEDRVYLEGLLMNMHEQFVDIVAKGRHMPREKAAALANGKIYTGQEALQLGLVDVLGGQDDAHDWLAEKTGVPSARKLLVRPVSRTQLLERLLALGKVFGVDLGEIINPENLGAGVIQPAFLY